MKSGPRVLRVSLASVVVIAAGACAGGAEEATGDRRDQIQAQPATTVPWSVFCADATGFVDFLDAEYAALFDPATAEGFMVATDGRLADLEVQAPEEVSGEVRALREAYSELSRLLAEVSYDVAKVDGDALIALIESEASLDFDNYLTAECGRGLAPVEGRGPQVLSDAELDELLGVDPADGSVDDVDAFLAGLLAEGSGIDRAAADCAVAGLDDDIKEALIAGGSTAETSGDEVRAALAVSLESCGVDPLDSSGEP